MLGEQLPKGRLKETLVQPEQLGNREGKKTLRPQAAPAQDQGLRSQGTEGLDSPPK